MAEPSVFGKKTFVVSFTKCSTAASSTLKIAMAEGGTIMVRGLVNFDFDIRLAPFVPKSMTIPHASIVSATAAPQYIYCMIRTFSFLKFSRQV